MENSNPVEAVKVVVLSHKRPTIINTPAVVDNCLVCVPKSQLKDYKAVNPEFEYLTHPDKVKGLPAKMQWVYDSLGDVFLLDDNLKGMCNMALDGAQVPAADAYRVIQAAADTCRAMGKYLFGFSQYSHPRHYNPFQPIRLTGWIPSQAIGLLAGSGLSFNQAMTGYQDLYISGMNAKQHRIIYKDTRFYFKQANRSRIVGGQSEYRNSDTDEQDIIELRKLFGDATKIKKGAGGKGYSTILQVPF